MRDIRIVKETDNWRAPKNVCFSNESMLPEASFACALMEKWGIVAAVPDGEDSNGRAKLAMQTPAEVVDRACEIAELAFKRFNEKGWLVHGATYEELNKPAEE